MTRKEAIEVLKKTLPYTSEFAEARTIAIIYLEAWDKVLDEFASSVPWCIMTNEDAAYLNGLDKGYEIVTKYLKEVEE